MKKALVLSLVLVFALTTSAFAGINFSGEFTVDVEQEAAELTWGEGDFVFNTTLEVSVSADGEEEGKWSLDAEITNLWNLENVRLGEYHLNVTDELFTVDVWGNEAKLSDLGDPIGLIEAGEESAGAGRVRFAVTPMDDVKASLDLDPGETLIGVGEFAVAGYDLGVALQRELVPNAAGDYENSVVGFGTFDVDIATIDVAAGMTLDADDSLAFGAKVSAPVTDEITIDAKLNQNNVGFAPGPDSSAAEAGITYEDAMIKANAKLALAGDFDGFANDSTTLSAYVTYRMSDTVDFGDLFDDYEDLDAPAAKLSFKNTANEGADTTMELTADVAAPLMPDFAWAKAQLTYATNDMDMYDVGEFGPADDQAFAATYLAAKLNAYVLATEKLTLKPMAEFINFSDGDVLGAPITEGSILTIEAKAEYAIGDAELAFTLGQTAYTDFPAGIDDEQYARFSVSVGF